MDIDALSSGFLSNTRLVLDAIEYLIASETAGEVFLCGSALKVILDCFLTAAHLDGPDRRLQAIVPNLSTLGSPLYAKLKQIACQVRVSPIAAHNLIVTDRYCLFVSVSDSIGPEYQLSGVLLNNAAAVGQARQYCQELCAKALPLF